MDPAERELRREIYRWMMCVETILAGELRPSWWNRVPVFGRVVAATRVALVIWLLIASSVLVFTPSATAQTPSEARTDAKLEDVNRRIEHIEGLRPEAVAEKVAQLQASVEKQQNILIALVLAVVTNIISSFPQFIEWKRKR